MHVNQLLIREGRPPVAAGVSARGRHHADELAEPAALVDLPDWPAEIARVFGGPRL